MLVVATAVMAAMNTGSNAKPAVGTSFAAFSNVRLVEPPLQIPRFDLKQHWHRKYRDDARHQWLRSLVAELFKDDKRWPG